MYSKGMGTISCGFTMYSIYKATDQQSPPPLSLPHHMRSRAHTHAKTWMFLIFTSSVGQCCWLRMAAAFHLPGGCISMVGEWSLRMQFVKLSGLLLDERCYINNIRYCHYYITTLQNHCTKRSEGGHMDTHTHMCVHSNALVPPFLELKCWDDSLEELCQVPLGRRSWLVLNQLTDSV